MHALSHPSEPFESRRTDARTNMFVSAAIESGALRAQVRIRNISPTGALIEGPALPDTGAHASLLRGTMVATGTIVRRDGPYGGMHFDRRTIPEYWMPSGGSAQQRIDRVVHIAREMFPDARPNPRYVQAHRSPEMAAAELCELAARIDTLADALADESELVARLYDKLQVLDIAAQKLRLLARNG